MKIKYSISLAIALVLTSTLFAQNDCPGIPAKFKFDTLGYISANIPTDPANPSGKMYLGQAWSMDYGLLQPGFIPSNKQSWGIAIAVAWNFARNMNQRVEYPPMDYWMATLLQETELRCATGMTWDNPSKVPMAYNPATVYAAQINNGCLQFEGPGTAWSALQQAYPNGRIPIHPDQSPGGLNAQLYKGLIEGVDGFEASALVKMYYDVYTSQIFNYNVGWDWYENVDCQKQCGDYAYIKMSASNYNAGPNNYTNAKTILDNVCNGEWTGLPATTAGYANDIARHVAALQNNTGYSEYAAGSSWGGWYNDAIPYSEVTKYLNIISPMYTDVNFATEVLPYVDAAFIAGAGSLAGTIDFQDFGDVIDAIVLHLPVDKPTPVDGSPSGINLGCTGDWLPYGHVDIIDGTTNLCLGQSVTLELTVDAGDDPNLTYKWFQGDAVNGTQIGTNKTITITPNAVGVQNYAGQICNANGCYTVYSNNQNACQDSRNLNGWNITTRDCNLCFTASGTSVNAVCKGTPDGSIQLTLANNPPANYIVTYTVTSPVGEDTITFNGSGNVIDLTGVRDGAYNFTITDATDPTCETHTSIVVGFDTDINEYIEANLGSLANCVQDVEAEIKEHPAPCLWKVTAHSPVFFQWIPAVNAVVSTSTGKTLIQKNTHFYPKPIFDQYSNAQVSEFYLSLESGESITMGTALTTTPGAQQLYDVEFNIYDESDVLMYTGMSPAYSSTFGNNHTVGSYTVTCPDVVPNYTINWNPGINNELTTSTKSEGDVNVQTTDRVYIVTATNNTNPQCILKDSVIVVGDPACGSVCKNPGTVQITDDAGTDIAITDTIWMCDTEDIKTKLTGSDAGGEFKYTLYKDQTVDVSNASGDFNLTTAGKYYVMAFDSTDAANTDCHEYSDTIVVMKPTWPTATTNLDDSICAGDSIQIDFTLTGTQPWTLHLDEGGTKSTVTGITSSPYSIFAKTAVTYTIDSVYDAYCGDEGSGTATVKLNARPTAALTGDATICAGDSAQLSVALTGTAPWSLKLNDGTNTSLATGITTSPYTYYVKTAGTYTVDSVFDAVCADAATGSATIIVNTAPQIDLGNDTSACSGPFTLDANNVDVSQTYEWSTGANTQTINVNDAGTNIYWVASAIGTCADTDSIQISINDTLPLNIGNDTTLCSAQAPVTLTAPTGFATYQWANVTALTVLGNANTQSTSTSGLHAVHVVDAQGCQGWDTLLVTINANPNQEIWTKDTLVTCAVSLPLNLDAGVIAGATYLWENGNTTQTSDATATGYKVVKWTVSGCSDSDSVYVDVGTSLSVDLGGDVTICPGDSVDLDSKINGGTYAWFEQDVLIAANGKTHNPGSGYTGEVKVVVSDANGCTGMDSIDITVNNPLTIELGNDVSICTDRVTNVDLQLVPARPGLNHLWNTGATTSLLSVLPTQTTKYYLDVDSAGCTANDTVSIIVNAIPDLSHMRDTFLCAGATATIDLDAGNAGSTYLWGGGTTNQTLTVNAAANYTVTVTDANNCTNDTTINVDNRVASIFSLADTTICPGGNAVFTVPANIQAEAGASWEWQDNTTANTFTANTAQNVTLTVTNASGCVSDTTVAIIVDNKFGTPLTLKDTVVCPAGLATFTVPALVLADPGATWTWQDNSTGNTFASNTAQAITLSVTNGLGCTSDTTVNLGVTNYLANISIADMSACEGDRVEVKSGFKGNAYTYSWNGGAGNNTDSIHVLDPVQLTDAGNITLDISTADGCAGSTDMDLTINVQPLNQLQTVALCAGASAQLDAGAGAGYTYVWSHDANETGRYVTVSAGGLYSVEITDGNGCKNDTSVTVSPSALPVISLGGNATYCEGNVVNIGSSLDPADHTFQWSGSSVATTATIDAVSSGSYTLTVTQVSTTCTNSGTATLTFNPVPNVVLPNDTSFCVGDNITLSSSDIQGSYAYQWTLDGSIYSSDPTINVSSAGMYMLSVYNGLCSDNAGISVSLDALPVSTLLNDTTLCFEDVVRGLLLDPGNDGISYLWSTGETIEFIRVEKPGTYTVEITNATGCVTEDAVTIKQDCPASLWLPNSITPNGDGLNDVWMVQGRGIKTIDVEIYNRWGELIWVADGLGDYWSAEHYKTGNPVAIDVYVWKASYTYENANGTIGTRNLVGTVSVIK